jgi:hypothetical protein
MRYQIISLVKKFHESLNPTREVLEKISSQIDTATAEYKAENAKEKPTPVIRGVLNRPQAEIDNEESRHTRHEGRDRVRLIVEVIALGIGAIVAGANVLLWIQTREATRIASISASAALKGADAAADQVSATKQSIEASIENFRLDQRAWLGYRAVGILEPITAHRPLRMVLSIKNTGKTPALKVRESTTTAGPNKPNAVIPGPSFKEKANGSIDSQAVVQPDGELTIPVDYPKDISQPFIDAIKAGVTTIYIVSKVTYSDVFGRTHYTTFCAELSATLNAFSECRNYNDTDDKFRNPEK